MAEAVEGVSELVAATGAVEVASAVVGGQLAGEAVRVALPAPDAGGVVAVAAGHALARRLVDEQAGRALGAGRGAVETPEAVRSAGLADTVGVCEEARLAAGRAGLGGGRDEGREARGAGSSRSETRAAGGVAGFPEPCSGVFEVADGEVRAGERVGGLVQHEQLRGRTGRAVDRVRAGEARRLAREALGALQVEARPAVRAAGVEAREVLAGRAAGAEVWPVQLAGRTAVCTGVALAVELGREARAAGAAGRVEVREVRLEACDRTRALGAVARLSDAGRAARVAVQAVAGLRVHELAFGADRAGVRFGQQPLARVAARAALVRALALAAVRVAGLAQASREVRAPAADRAAARVFDQVSARGTAAAGRSGAAAGRAAQVAAVAVAEAVDEEAVSAGHA